MTDINAREREVFNWATQEIDGSVKLGDKIAEMLETDGGSLAAVPATNQPDSTASTIAATVIDFNALLTKLKAAGLMVADT